MNDGPFGSGPKPRPWSPWAWVQLIARNLSPTCASCARCERSVGDELVRTVRFAARPATRRDDERAPDEADRVGGRPALRIDEAGERERHRVNRRDAGHRRDLGSAWPAGTLLDRGVDVSADRRGERVGCGTGAARARGQRQHRAGHEPDDDRDDEYRPPPAPQRGAHPRPDRPHAVIQPEFRARVHRTGLPPAGVPAPRDQATAAADSDVEVQRGVALRPQDRRGAGSRHRILERRRTGRGLARLGNDHEETARGEQRRDRHRYRVRGDVVDRREVTLPHLLAARRRVERDDLHRFRIVEVGDGGIVEREVTVLPYAGTAQVERMRGEQHGVAARFGRRVVGAVEVVEVTERQVRSTRSRM